MKQQVSFLCLGFLLSVAVGPSWQACSQRESKDHVGGAIKPMIEGLTDEMVDYVNEIANSTWTAGPQTKFKDVHALRKFTGVLEDPNGFRLPKMCKMLTQEQREAIPKEFDSRSKWSQCASISRIRDQSDCGSCWAFGAVEAMSDRHCIAADGKDVELAATDLLACCGSFCGNGCQGGFPAAAWDFWVTKGIVTGGAYDSKEGCRPYPFAPCEHHVNGSRNPCSTDLYPTPQCEEKCLDGYAKSYADDKNYGQRAYTLSGDVQEIQHEIMTRGPVEADFTVFADFPNYKSGVYQHIAGLPLGGHAIRILGWGEEQGVPYWLCANSWNSDWGNKGYFKILRGKNECGIETDVNAGVPRA